MFYLKLYQVVKQVRSEAKMIALVYLGVVIARPCNRTYIK